MATKKQVDKLVEPEVKTELRLNVSLGKRLAVGGKLIQFWQPMKRDESGKLVKDEDKTIFSFGGKQTRNLNYRAGAIVEFNVTPEGLSITSGPRGPRMVGYLPEKQCQALAVESEADVAEYYRQRQEEKLHDDGNDKVIKDALAPITNLLSKTFNRNQRAAIVAMVLRYLGEA